MAGDRLQPRERREQTCCMREPMGKCHPLAMTACSRIRPTWHSTPGSRAEATVRPPPWQLRHVLRDNEHDSETDVVSDWLVG